MILKLYQAEIGGDRLLPILIDNIGHIKKEFIEKFTPENTEQHYDFNCVKIKDKEQDPSKGKSPSTIIQLILFLRNGKSKLVITNLPGWVMNDKGETIDRIDLF